MSQNKKICCLSELFDSNLGMPHKYYALGGRIEETRDKIVKAQPPKKRNKINKLLLSLCNDYEEMNCIDADKHFEYGFSLAVQLMSEAFSVKIQ